TEQSAVFSDEMLVIPGSDFIALDLSWFQSDFLSRLPPIFDQSMDRFRHDLKRKAPASPEEHIVREDDKALPGKLIGKSSALIEVRPDIFHGYRRRIFPICYLLFAEELHTVMPVQGNHSR